MRLPERIGRYRVQALIGSGGFGFVVRAYDEALDDSVAIKVLADNWATDANIRSRFVEEARLLRRIRSDDLVTVHDIGELDDGRPYFVMTFAERGTLSDRLAARHGIGLDPTGARKLVTTLAGGLAALHAAGIVHRDVNPRNILLRPLNVQPAAEQRRVAITQVRTGLVGSDERLLLGDLGLAKDFLRSGAAGASVLGGTPHYVAPEQLDPAAQIGPATDIYAATGVLWETVTATQPPRPGDLRTAIAAVDEPWRPFFLRGLAEDPGDRHGDIGEWKAQVTALLVDAEGVVGGGHQASRTAVTNPYKGLAAFQPEDATRFFGRDDLVSMLVDRLAFDRVLIVGGPSGSGKSSVVRAGLIPAIGAGAHPGSERWPVALFTPRSSPSAELSYHITRLSQAVTQRTIDLPANLDSRDAAQARYLADGIADASGGLLLVIDQFEELFTLNSRNDQQAFIDVLSALADPTDSRTRIVIVVRADFYAACAAFPWLVERITANQVLVGPMTRPELRKAIEQPAMVAALRLQDGLVDAVLDDGADEPGALPLVSHAMAETWRRRNGSTLTVEGYRQAGGVVGAIAQTAEALYEGRFDELEQEACRRLMLRLVAPGEGTSDSRRRMPVTSLEFDEAPETSRRVAEEMVEARLLLVDRESVEIAHEALLRTWPRLRRWIDDSRDDLRMRQRIGHATGEWLGQNRDPDLLYRGTPLQSALEWAVEHGDVLAPDDRQFLETSERALRLAEETAAAQESRSRRIRRIAVSVLAVLTVFAVGASAVALSALGEATSRFGQTLATQAVALADREPRVAAALAVEAMARGETESLDARVALVESATQLAAADYAPAVSPVVVGNALSVAVSSTGDLIATGNRDGSVSLWTARGDPLDGDVPGHEKAINEMVFTPDGQTLVTASDDGTVRIWDVTDPTDVPAPLLVGQAGRLVWSVDISPDGATLATASEDGTVMLWDLATRQPIGDPVADSTRDFLTVSFSPDGALLLAGNGRGEVTGWSLPSRETALDTFSAHGSDVWEIEFDASGDVFATASSDGRIRVWETATGALVGEPFEGAAADVRGVLMIGDGRLAAGDEAGRLWTAAFDGTARRFVPSPHLAQVIDAAAGGGILVTIADDQQLQPWTAANIPTSIEIGGFARGAFAVAVSPDGEHIAIGDGDGTLTMVSPSGEVTATFRDVHQGTVWALAFDGSGARLASGGEDGVVVIHDLETGAVGSTLAVSELPISAVLFTGDLVVTGSADEMVRLWDGDQLRDTLPGHRGGVTAMALGPDGTLAVADRSGGLSLWDVETGEVAMPTMAAENDTIWDVAWSIDGSLIATASADESVQLWTAATLEPLATLAPHDSGALGVVFLSDGETLAATSGDGSVRLWDVTLARTVGGALDGHTDAARGIAAIPDRLEFVTTSADGSVRIWDVLDTTRACERAAGAFDAEQQRRFLGNSGSANGCAATP